MNLPERVDVVVVGAGLAGLACARVLQAAGVDCLVLERSDAVGGRVRTDVVDGFRLDRGFQVYLTAYPAGRRELDYADLDLRPFVSGARIRKQARWYRLADPLRNPLSAPAGLLAPIGNVADKLRVLRLRQSLSRASIEQLFSKPELRTEDALRSRWGFSEGMIDDFFRPFLGGVTLDRDLGTSSRSFEFVMKMFSEGDAAVPALGMQRIPEQLAAALAPGTVRTGVGVATVRRGSGVVLDGGGELGAAVAVLATDGSEASRLLNEPVAPEFSATTCLYFAARRSPAEGGLLMLNTDGGGLVNNVAVMSDVAPEYAPPDRALVSVSVLGVPTADDADLERRVRGELVDWFGASASDWRCLRIYRIHHALPRQRSLNPDRTATDARVAEGLYVCGDHRAHASIHGALESGRRAAEALLAGRGQSG